uniref:Serine/threonine-protein phosphatase PGAM5, mitochondrial n=1 Tax=Phallusia mammillata TaxID=59560 RepID=A0A6F9DP92_9ASCI|nr:serine/threonine-protein phosphatase PGAM5, mitochondrial-like [Phallusia mammillata]
MKRHLWKMVGLAATGGATVSVIKYSGWNKKEQKSYNLFSPFLKTAHAAVSEASKWDNDWDKRACDKSTATRHIILIRHGQYNLAGKGDEERYLTSLGKEQASLTGLRLKELGLDKKLNLVTYSTMTRAKETCDLIYKQLDAPITLEKSDLLREGAPIEPDPPTPHWAPDPKTFFIDSARIETAFRHFMHRADPDQKDDSYEILVCHANVIRFFVCRALQIPPEAWLRISLRHASITSLSIRPNGKVSLKCLGDSGHLPPDKLTFE